MGELLQKHLEAGNIFVDNGEYIGRAADGVEVWLGIEGEEANLNEYLKSHSEPENW